MSDFAYFKEEGSRYVVGYGLTQLNESLCEWFEVYIYKRQQSIVTLQDVKQVVLADINARTDEKILSGFRWTPPAAPATVPGDSVAGETIAIPVWLSTENQFNFKAAYDLAVQKQGATLPVTFKLGELEDGTPVYHTFTTMEESEDFYVRAVTFINQTLAEGWQEKDSIDWQPYEALFPATAENTAENNAETE